MDFVPSGKLSASKDGDFTINSGFLSNAGNIRLASRNTKYRDF